MTDRLCCDTGMSGTESHVLSRARDFPSLHPTRPTPTIALRGKQAPR